MKKITLLIAILLIAAVAHAQSKDVVYLKNGSVIRGKLLEVVPNGSVKIETSDKSVFVYPMDEVDRITKEEVAIQSEGSSNKIPTQKYESRKLPDSEYTWHRRLYVGGSLGVSIPLKNPHSYGSANPGFLFNFINAGLLLSDNLGIHANVIFGENEYNSSYISNSSSSYYDSEWSYSGMLFGPIVSANVSPKFSIDFRPGFGFMYVSSPSFYWDGSYNNPSYTYWNDGTHMTYSMGISFCYKLSRHFAVSFNTEYLNIQTGNRGGANDMHMLNLSMGVAYTFSKRAAK